MPCGQASGASASGDWRVCIDSKFRRRLRSTRLSGQVASIFSLPRWRTETLFDAFELELSAGQIVAVVGPSGSGKSVLLREVSRQVPDAVWLRTDRLARSDRPAVDLIGGGTLPERLELLSRCGLAEATIMAAPARVLSGGQIYRLALARAIARARRRCGKPALVLADEFAAVLDFATAQVLCRQIRKLINSSPVALLLATPRVELLDALQPDLTVVKPLGEPARLWRHHSRARRPCYHSRAGPACSPQVGRRPCHWAITRGNIHDYDSLASFHYCAGRPATHKRVYVIRPAGVPAGDASPDAFPAGAIASGAPAVAAVLVVSPPLMNCRGRNASLPGRYTLRDRREAMRRLNAEIEAVSRVIVHPTYRGCGLSVRLVRHALAAAETPMTEALAAMGDVHPFFEKAGMRRMGRYRGRKGHYVYYLNGLQ